MAATAVDVNKIDEVVEDKPNEVVRERSNATKKSGSVDEKSGNIAEVAAKESKMIELVSSDGDRFEITHEAAAMSQTIHHMIEDDCTENGVPLPNVNSKILAMVIEYYNKHVAGTSDSEKEDLKSFDEKFIKVDQATLFDIIRAANYLGVKELLDLSCQTVAETVEEIRDTFNIKNDFTPEEKEEIRKENLWAFE